MAVDIDDPAALESALQGADLVVHTAGPFQRKATCGVLEAAIATRTPYMDVCDDADYSQRAKGCHERACAAGVPAITTAGKPPFSLPGFLCSRVAAHCKVYFPPFFLFLSRYWYCLLEVLL